MNMKRNVDILLFIVFCALSGTGIGMEYLGKSGGGIHLILGIAMIILVVIHLVLNRKWFVEVLCKGSSRAAIAVCILGFLLAVISTIALPDKGQRHRHRQEGPPPPAAAAGMLPR